MIWIRLHCTRLDVMRWVYTVDVSAILRVTHHLPIASPGLTHLPESPRVWEGLASWKITSF